MCPGSDCALGTMKTERVEQVAQRLRTGSRSQTRKGKMRSRVDRRHLLHPRKCVVADDDRYPESVVAFVRDGDDDVSAEEVADHPISGLVGRCC